MFFELSKSSTLDRRKSDTRASRVSDTYAPEARGLFIRYDIQERTQTMSVRVKGRRHARSYVSTYVLLIGNWVTKAISKPGI